MSFKDVLLSVGAALNPRSVARKAIQDNDALLACCTSVYKRMCTGQHLDPSHGLQRMIH